MLLLIPWFWSISGKSATSVSLTHISGRLALSLFSESLYSAVKEEKEKSFTSAELAEGSPNRTRTVTATKYLLRVFITLNLNDVCS